MKSLSDYRPRVYDTVYVDAMNLLSRSHHGMSGLTYRGERTGMIYGVARFVLDWRKRSPKTRIVFVWEGRNSWRKDEYPIYKANRVFDRSSGDSREFFDCVERVKYSLPVMGIYQCWSDTYEADDVVYTLAKHDFYARDDSLLFSSGDWDWWELVMYGNILYQHRTEMSRAELDVLFTKKFNAPPIPMEKLWIFKVLTGDASDNVSGVPRFPRKLAAEVCRYPGVGEGDILHTLIRMGEEKWAKRVADNRWIVDRNVVLLRSSNVPMGNIQTVGSAYDYDAFGKVLVDSGMEALYERHGREGHTTYPNR